MPTDRPAHRRGQSSIGIRLPTRAELGNVRGLHIGISKVKALRVLPVVALAFALSSCGGGSVDTPTSTTTATTSTTTTSTSALPSTETAAPETITTPASTYVEPVVEEPVTVAEPYIVDCQFGLGPIVTYWSDGTVTGYSDYCQSVHDQVLANEVAANTPLCDGTVCRYPSGATIPDPNATPKTPSPWVQGQLDWQECKEAGNTDEYCRQTLN